ncbi:MAG: hypothetical protein FJX74_08500, partial [Armatimonadetes bacterium]|nr:hypothetical protein [Armatimonadota bacterium]
MVAITFTEKAAGELKGRLRDLCDSRAEAADSEEERRAWSLHRRSIDNAHIGTIHGFCSRMLRSHAVRLGLDPLFGVLDETRQQLLARETARRFVLQAVRAGDAPLRDLVSTLGLEAVVSGFSFALNERAKPPVHNLYASAAAVAARWQEATNAELEAVLRRVRTDPGLLAAAQVLVTVRALRADDKLVPYQEAILADLPAAFDPEAEFQEGVGAWLTIAGQRKPGNAGAGANWPDDGKAQVLEAIRRLQTAGAEFLRWEPADAELLRRSAELTAAFHGALPAALEAYAAAKRELSAVDFDDQLLLARDLLRDAPDVRGAEQKRFDQLLVDEFQD